MSVAPPRRGAVLLFAVFFALGPMACHSSAQMSNKQSPAGQLASDKIEAATLAQYADQAVQLEREYLQINTSNPPGNELATAPPSRPTNRATP